MKIYKILGISLFTCFSLQAFAQFKKLHNKAIVIDAHNDILTTCFEHGYSFDQDLKGKTHSDLARFKEGGIDVQIFSVWCDGKQLNPFAYATGR